MTEQDFINASTLVRIRVASTALGELHLGELLADDVTSQELEVVNKAKAALCEIGNRIAERIECREEKQ